jgi:hypothetical protein
MPLSASARVLRHPTAWLGAAWAATAHLRTRSRLRKWGTGAIAPTAPRLIGAAGAGVAWWLTVSHASCLERSLVLQSWVATRTGEAPDVVIGVRRGPFGAHAWLDGEDTEGHIEVRRVRRSGP